MPHLADDFKPHPLFLNKHLQTILPSVIRRIKMEGVKERIHTPDNDFFDVFWHKKGFDKLVVILHGLESTPDRAYLLGMVRTLHTKGFDCVIIAFRGCSDELNNKYSSYHSGFYDDLHYFTSLGKLYKENYLLGFSLGGNVVLRYMGTFPNNPFIKAAAVSVPIDLTTSSEEFRKPVNKIYMNRFITKLRAKVYAKLKQHAVEMDVEALEKAKNFHDFDHLYTAPAHGFKNEYEYWKTCSSLPLFPSILKPFLLINAQNDTFLSPLCYPIELAEKQQNFFLLTPQYGGHVGFSESMFFKKHFWHEQKVAQFFSEEW